MSETRSESRPLDLQALRLRLQRARGPEYWRSLEELADSPDFRELLENEFPRLASRIPEGVNRRDVLRLMGASLALAGLSACTRPPDEKIVPYVRAPENLVPGKPKYYATSVVLGGYATGVLVESHLGRPTRIDGNPQHPASLGGADALSQATILGLYDPDRSQYATFNGRISSWAAFQGAMARSREALGLKKGAGLRILTDAVTSPTLEAQIREMLVEFPEARWHQFEPAGEESARSGSVLAFGRPLHTVCNVAAADVILSLDSDFLACGPGHLRHARDWASRRSPNGGRGMNRMYAVESCPASTGAAADHRLALRPSEVEPFARALARTLGLPVEAPSLPEPQARWVAATAADLSSHRGASLVIPGLWQSPAVHALSHAINAALGNAGTTLFYTDPVQAGQNGEHRSLVDLVEDIKAGRVELLLMLGGNPAYSAPADLDFPIHLARVPLRIHLSAYQDETSRLCNWHLPAAHPLEAWSDARAFDGTAGILQPLIAPLYSGRSAHEVLSIVAGRPGVTGHELVREHWRARLGGTDFERLWQTALHDGLVAGTALPPKSAALRQDWNVRLGAPRRRVDGMEIAFRPDPSVWDGCFANNGWLQELPKPLTKLTWDNAALVSPATAEELGLRSKDLVELRYRGSAVRAPVWIVPGHADGCVTAHLGYGRSQAGKVGSGAGFRAYTLRTSDAPWNGPALEIAATGLSAPLACTQDHHSMDGRHLVREGTLQEFAKNPRFAREMAEEPEKGMSLYPPWEYKGHAWGMSINLSACIGCNACMVACQAENNIPVVGKEQVLIGREMHWIRIDRYYKGAPDDPEAVFQPVACQHCEKAPCEPVCPVAATAHSSEGLNQMVYNRCVGTRYCSNNCPYKVRRFNFMQYADYETPSLVALRNPDVTVRARGVMEKCTYCVQRINGAKIEAEKQDRAVRDGEIVTACQGACPTGAIVFGDLNDRAGRVAALEESPLSYGLLAELNTRPRTRYLARLRNPNPALEKENG